METVVRKKGFLEVSRSLWHDPRTWLFLLAVTEKSLFRYMMLVVSRVTGLEDIGVIIMHIAYVVLIAMCLKRGSRFRGGDIGIMLFVCGSILLTWLIYPDNIDIYMFGQGQFWPTVFPLFRFFIVGLFLIPDEESVDLMGKISCISIFVESIFIWFILRGSDMQNNDDMSRAYFLLLTVLFAVNYAYDKRTFWGLAASAVGILALLSMGTRGPIMITLAFFAAKIYQTSTKKGKGTIVIIVILLLMWFVNSSLWNAFLLFLRDIISTIGLSTRIIDYTIQGETLSNYSERDEIFDVVISKIHERPLTGWGLYGEWQFVGWSAHNMYLEILQNYGVFIGGIILLWMFYIAIKAFFTTKSIPVRSLVLMFICNVFVRGFFGGTFLSFPTFLMIGYCLQICRKTNIRYLKV